MPSGISERPVLLSWSMSIRRTVSVALSARLERDAGGGFGGDHAGELAAVGGEHGVAEVLRIHLAVGIEHVEQDRLGPAGFHRGQVGADVVADALHACGRRRRSW